MPLFDPTPDNPDDAGWAEIREEQRAFVESDPAAVLVVTIDTGELRNIHPVHKSVIVERVANAALEQVHGLEAAYRG